ncbi:hypothetical protein FQN54_009371 [Arachnomyces sp. PD_36]|nr:hypothetical protein FQN54_009371 [Arachnomyces sp. PD_36]
MPNTKPTSSLRSRPTKPTVERSVKNVVLGNILFKTWFHSLYPEDLVSNGCERLYICRWCFRYSSDLDAYAGHTHVCDFKTDPPGTKVYEYEGYTVREVDGEEYKLFAQNLSLFAKLFLDHKSVFFDVSSFLYYILSYTNPQDPTDYHVLGYFSKEKLSWDANNLACILIFPPYQHKQLGKLLMGISYKLSGWEWEGGVIGGPEKPLSEMGKRSYVRFWEERIARYFLLGPPGGGDQPATSPQNPGKSAKKRPAREKMTVREIGQATGMLVEDVITALKGMGILETENSGKSLKQDSPLWDGDTLTAEPAIIRKESVLEWVKIHRVDSRDPVREEGFLGEWAADADSNGDEES